VLFLLACLAVTLVAMTAHGARTFARRRALARLAAARDMHFAAGDRFNLAADVARQFPVLGAASPSVSDLLYGRRGGWHCYAFRFEYTVGVTGPRSRRRAVVGFVEPRDARAPRGAIGLVRADARLPETRQYEQVLERLDPCDPPRA
jgi:hypothetical protein